MPTESSVIAQKPTASAVSVTGVSRPDSEISARSLAHVTDSGAADLTTSGETAGVDTISEASTGTLVIDAPLVPSESSDADNDSTVVAQAPDPVTSTASVGVVSGLLSAVGLGSPLSTVDGPVEPLPGVILVGSLDLMRRDLERMNDDQLAVDTQQVANTLTAGTPSEEWVPVTTTADSDSGTDPEHPSWSVPDQLTVEPTPAERATAYQKAQTQRLDAFNQAQAARTEAFNEQLAQHAENPLGALVASAAFVVSELANTAAVVVTEFVNYLSFAVTEFIHGLTDWFRAPAVFTGLYGDPDDSAQYWRVQTAENCVLQSAAMIVGQLTGTTPEEADIAQKAMEADSVANPGEKMYEGLHTQDRVDIRDAIALLESDYGITATLTKYEKTEGNLALRALAFALEDSSKAVSVGVQGGTIWNAVEGDPLPGISSADHQVVVTGIDFDERVVYLNDSGFPEQGKKLKVPLDAFMRAWQTDNYETMIAQLKQPNTTASEPGSHRISSPDSGLLLEVA
ncbi:hypothetical protein AU184_14000 [Mycolicibacterium novocastrense]|nr:hypothetical protein AU183_10315 [Mycolicibacterium novocastrense]KUH78100.1 hypothetical protein AU072_09080 [Mycolicibacterium novocastrense]KUH79435.1 hypothetical protein AU184_14000 [Mycolicibacterium novocastrense]